MALSSVVSRRFVAVTAAQRLRVSVRARATRRLDGFRLGDCRGCTWARSEPNTPNPNPNLEPNSALPFSRYSMTRAHALHSEPCRGVVPRPKPPQPHFSESSRLAEQRSSSPVQVSRWVLEARGPSREALQWQKFEDTTLGYWLQYAPFAPQIRYVDVAR